MKRVLGSTNGKVLIKLYDDQFTIYSDSNFPDDYEGEFNSDYFESLVKTISDYMDLFNPEVILLNVHPCVNLEMGVNRVIIGNYSTLEELFDHFRKKIEEN